MRVGRVALMPAAVAVMQSGKRHTSSFPSQGKVFEKGEADFADD